MESDASHLDYGSELLSKATGQAPTPGQPPPVANDTRIVMGRLDQKLYASAEANNPKAAVRLGSDMGEFFMPYPGTRINQETAPLNANGYHRQRVVLRGQVQRSKQAERPDLDGRRRLIRGEPPPDPQRWFVVWLGTANDPVDKGAAKALAESIQPGQVRRPGNGTGSRSHGACHRCARARSRRTGPGAGSRPGSCRRGAGSSRRGSCRRRAHAHPESSARPGRLPPRLLPEDRPQ